MAIALTASRPPRAKHAAVFCVDENYFPFACFAAEQLHRKSGKDDLDIVICAPAGCAVPETLGHINARLCELETGDQFSGLYLDARRTESVYHRLALPVAMEKDYDRILYLDADIFIHGGDFITLFDVPLGGHAVGAVRDSYQWMKPDRQMPDFANIGLPQAKYFNSGVILMDVAAYVAQDIFGQCVTYGRANNDKLRQHDQELINCVLHGNWAELSPIWNWQQPIRSAYYEVMQPIAITHFIGPHKPWRDPKRLLPPRFALAIGAFMTKHFPASPQIDVPNSQAIYTGYIRKLTFKNLVRTAALRRYMLRFPDDLLEKTP